MEVTPRTIQVNQTSPRPPIDRVAQKLNGTKNSLGFLQPSWPSKIFILLLTIVSLLVIAFIGAQAYASLKGDQAIKSKQYQAVFLGNGQVYFGHVSQINNRYIRLTDIYYLQVQQQVQPEEKDKKDGEQPQMSLAKLGGEIHGPDDEMFISREQVSFWENLKDDGKVVQAIREYQKKK
jgi:hypothetical protein